MKAVELHNLLFSPPWIAKLLQFFISGALSIKPIGIKLELVYFVIPFIVDEEIEKKLSRANIKSTFDSVFETIELKNSLIGKLDKVTNYKHITNQGLVYLNSYVTLSMGANILIDTLINYKEIEADTYIKNKYKAANNWGIILAKEDYLNVILKIGAYSS